MSNSPLSNYVADLMSFTSAPTVPRELAVTVSSLAVLGVAWAFVDDRGFLTVFSLVLGAYLALRLALTVRKQVTSR